MQTTTVDGFVACCSALISRSFDLRPLAPQLRRCVKQVCLVVGENDANLPESMELLRRDLQGGWPLDITPSSFPRT